LLYGEHHDRHYFPTRRSSDLITSKAGSTAAAIGCARRIRAHIEWKVPTQSEPIEKSLPIRSRWSLIRSLSSPAALSVKVKTRISDRKSTRLNSSHVKISYAV